ncbi:Hypothetical predicted protein [Octopus vulgaris]|uniref:Uncharacterized protein n=1 Tax=Octopus vulgaris TaxID=6645 RepID=A0AA36B8Y5_OCTVU|nr:Hypothetical predicted protein [Octopus vulgaris]
MLTCSGIKPRSLWLQSKPCNYLTMHASNQPSIRPSIHSSSHPSIHPYIHTSENENTYAELLRNLQLLYSDYKFRFIPVIIGALGYVTHCLNTNLEKLGFSKPERRKLI